MFFSAISLPYSYVSLVQAMKAYRVPLLIPCDGCHKVLAKKAGHPTGSQSAIGETLISTGWAGFWVTP
jgi:hypothetical protein